MSNHSQSLLVLLENGKEFDVPYNGTAFTQNTTTPSKNTHTYPSGALLMRILTILICLLGLVGNGVTIWLLGFRIKKNNFTTYILNLSIADFGVVSTVFAYTVYWILYELKNSNYFLFTTVVLLIFLANVYIASLCFLTTISIDRCVSLLFPFWYRCHRPSYLSSTVCVLIWIFTFLFLATDIILLQQVVYFQLYFYQCLMNSIILTSLISLSTIILVIKVCLISRKHKRGKLITAILFTLLCFLLFGLPMILIPYLFYSVLGFDNAYLSEYCLLSGSVNSTVNPLIYFLVGKEKRGQARKSLKVIMEKMFNEEKESKDETGASSL